MVLDMTEGKPIKKILIFFLPVLLGNLLQQFYSLADSMIVSRFLGVSAFAGVTATGSLTFLILGFTWGITSGCAIPVAQEFGAKDYGMMRRCFANSLYLCGGIAVALAVITAILTSPILRLVGTPEDIFGYSAEYLRVIFIGIPASVSYNLFAGVMRAVGDGRTPLFMLLFSSLLNIALDLLFVVTFDWGIAGAAWATILSQAVSAVLCFIVLRKKFEILRVKPDEKRFDGAIARRLAGMGLPMGLQFSITAIGSTVLQSAVNSIGSSAVAAIGAGSKVQFVFTTPIDAMGNTMATYCGQNKGAKRYDRVRHGVLLITVIMVCYCAVSYLLQRLVGVSLVKLFIGISEESLIGDTSFYLNAVIAFSFLLALVMIYRNAIQGLGYSKAAMFAGLMEVFGRVFVSLVFVKAYGFTGACFAHPTAWLCADILLVPMFFVVLKKLEKGAAQ